MRSRSRQHGWSRPPADRVVGWVVAAVLAVLVLLPLLAVVLQVVWPGLFAGDLTFGDLRILAEITERPLWRASLVNSLRLATGAMLLGDRKSVV